MTTAALRRKLAEMLSSGRRRTRSCPGRSARLSRRRARRSCWFTDHAAAVASKGSTPAPSVPGQVEHTVRGSQQETYGSRIKRSTDRERSAFLQNYNARLLNGLLMLSIGGIVTFRFLYTNALGELVAWCLFIALEVGPKLYLGGDGMFESAWWTTAFSFGKLPCTTSSSTWTRSGPCCCAPRSPGWCT